MTQNEFEIRLRKITREAVNRNPGLAQELMQHAQQTEFLSGIRLIKDPKEEIDKLAAKQAAEEQKLFIAQAKSAGVFINPTQLRDPMYQAGKNAEVQTRMIEKGMSDELTRATQAGESIDAANSKEAALKIPAAMRGRYGNDIEQFKALVGEATTGNTGDKAMIISLMNEQIPQKVNDFKEELLFQKVNGDLAERKGAEYERMLTALTANITADVSGGRIDEILTNTMGTYRNLQEIDVLSKYNVAEMKLVNAMAITPLYATFAAKNEDLSRQAMSNFTDIVRGSNSRGAVQALIQDNIHPGRSDAAFMLGASVSSQNDVATQQILTSVAEMTVQFKEKNFKGSLGDKIKAQSEIVSEIGKIEYKDMINATPEAKKAFTDISRDYLSDAGKAFRRRVDTLSEAGVKVVTKFDGNGSMIITAEGASKAVETELNRKYAAAFNAGVKGFANMNAETWSDASGRILDQFAGDWYINDPGNPLLGVVKQKGGATDDYFNRLISSESNFKNDAQNPNSSARGPAQFLNSTWMETVGKHAPEVLEGKSKEEVLEMRTDPKFVNRMLAGLTSDNAQTLKQNGVAVNDPNLHLAHFLGATGASNLLKASPNDPVSDILGAKAIRDNASILEGKKVKDVIQWARGKQGVV